MTTPAQPNAPHLTPQEIQKQTSIQRLLLEQERKQHEIDNTGNEGWINSLCEQLCKMEDALGFKNDCHDKKGKWVPTIGPWLERVRDLLAAEGEVGDLKEALEHAQQEHAEDVKAIEKWTNALRDAQIKCDELQAKLDQAETSIELLERGKYGRSDLQGQVEKLQKAVSEMNGQAISHTLTIEGLKAQLQQSEAAGAEMRLSLEWFDPFSDMNQRARMGTGRVMNAITCPACGYENEHAPLCWLKKALSTTCGQPLLDRLERLNDVIGLLRYVVYLRLPLGDTVFDHLDFERQKQASEALESQP